MTYWWYVKLPYATFAIEVDTNFVTQAPPIARWMVGKKEEEVLSWIYKKKGSCEEMKGE